MSAIIELYQTLGDALREAWQAADLMARLRAWWWVVRHSELVDVSLHEVMSHEASHLPSPG